MSDKDFTKELDKYADTTMSTAMQTELNKALPKALDPAMEEYMHFVLNLVKNKTINPLQPSSLIHQEIYDGLEEVDQDHVDIACVNLCGFLRQLVQLDALNQEYSYQTESLIGSIFQTKERLENRLGDVLYL